MRRLDDFIVYTPKMDAIDRNMTESFLKYEKEKSIADWADDYTAVEFPALDGLITQNDLDNLNEIHKKIIEREKPKEEKP